MTPRLRVTSKWATARRLSFAILLASTMASPALAGDAPDDLAGSFAEPPVTARPWVWWHWMNGNITKDGIAEDLAWMQRIGIAGAQTFDANLATPQIVDRRLTYMSPEWKDAFRFAASEADRLGLGLAIASSPGWSETGGPWVPPQDAMKKLVWSVTIVSHAQRSTAMLPRPADVAGPFQDAAREPSLSERIGGKLAEPGPRFYRDVMVLAVPVAPAPALPSPTMRDLAGRQIDVQALRRGTGVVLGSVLQAEPLGLIADFGRTVAIRSATLRIPDGVVPLVAPLFGAQLEASEDSTRWRPVADVPLAAVPTTVGFPAVQARYFRLLVRSAMGSGPGAPARDTGIAMPDPFAKVIGGMLSSPVRVATFDLSSEAQVDRFEEKAGFATVPDYYRLPAVADGASGPPPSAVVDLTSRMQPDGRLDWTPPAGSWRVLRLGYSLEGTTNHPATAEATGLETDKFDPQAVRRYLDHYLASYRDAVGPNLIGKRGVTAFLTDSTEVGASNWTPSLIADFKRLRGYDPVPWLPTLTGTLIGTREESERFLYDFRLTLSDLMSEAHYKTVASAAHENGLSVFGEALESNRSSLGDDMAMRQYTDFPMAAMWAFGAEGPRPGYVVDIKGAASVAHLYGQNIVAAESMTAAMKPWAFGPADLKRVADAEFVLGVNRPVIHTSVHQPVNDKVPGLSLGGIGQYFNRNESWSGLARPWVDYLSRNAFMLQQGRNVADFAYFYGEEAPLSGLYAQGLPTDLPTANAFDFINSDALLTAVTVKDGEIVSTGGARYKALFLGGSSSRMTVRCLQRLAELVRDGATVIGLKPADNPSLTGTTDEFSRLTAELWSGQPVTKVGKGQVVATTNLQAGLDRIGVTPDFRFTSGGQTSRIAFAHRTLADGDTYFLVNQGGGRASGEARFRVAGKVPLIWRAEDGTREPVSYRIVGSETIVPLTFEPEESYFVTFVTPDTHGGEQTIVPRSTKTTPISGAWSVSFQSGRGAPASINMPKLQPLNENDVPGVRYFSGEATYRIAFETPRGWKPGDSLQLDLGDAREIAEVSVNDRLAGSAWHAPYKIEIGKLARAGQNRLQVRVANLWVNRLIGDARGIGPKITWTDQPTYTASAALRSSGLIGPVTLVSTR